MPGPTIDVPPAELYALGRQLGDRAATAAEVAGRLTSPAAVGGPIQPALSDLLFCSRTAATALAGELHWLGSTIAAVADSWLGLDRSLLAGRGRAVAR